jgi:hypothetical protein
LADQQAFVSGKWQAAYSAVDVMRDQGIALREVSALGTLRTRACLDRLYATNPVTVGLPGVTNVRVSSLPAALAAPRMRGLRITGSTLTRRGGRKESFFIDVVAMASRRAVIELHTAATHRTYPVATERRVLLVLLRRADESAV